MGRAKHGSELQEDTKMRVMMIVKASKESEAGVMPSADELDAMGKYNGELVKAGVLLAGKACIRARRASA